jgi:hypothetical protein
MNKAVMAVLGIVFLGGCAWQGPQGNQGEPGSSPASSVPINVQGLVSDYNQWREAQGQEDIIPGLNCTLYEVPNTTTQIVGTLLTTAAGVTTVGSFEYLGNFNVANSPVTSGFPVLPLALQSVVQTWFIMKCTGYLVVTTSGYTEFDTNSDDGSNLYVDGTLVVNNDGLHSAKQVFGMKNLQAEVHSFELDYLEGGGFQQLVVNMNGSLLPAANLYH